MGYAIKTLSQLRPILLGFRKEAGLTQQDLAEQLGISQQSYARIEAKPETMGVERLFRILALLNVEIELSPKQPGKLAPAPKDLPWSAATPSGIDQKARVANSPALSYGAEPDTARPSRRNAQRAKKASVNPKKSEKW